MLRYLLPLGIFFILAIFLYVGLSLNPRDIGSTRIDKPAPAFTLPRLNTDKTFSNQDFIGKVSLFNVWASWCGTCRYEHPLLMYLAKQGYVVYGLNYKDTRAEAKAVLTRSGNPYIANAFDEKGSVGMDWGVTGTPETFVIDKQGIVRYKRTGQLTEELWLKEIKPLIHNLLEEIKN
jgi:cytochrome c biogenesis protein CcmG/thiol:disulfide interchange protein DsbE